MAFGTSRPCQCTAVGSGRWFVTTIRTVSPCRPDEKPRNPQVLVGLVLVDGWPIAHHVFAGNQRDAKTVPDVVRDVEQRFGIKRMVFVGDRGMVTASNLAQLRSGGHGYIVGRNRSRSGEIFDYIQSATGPWIECPIGITAREKATRPKTLVQEVASNKPGVRVFVVHSDERLAYEKARRTKSMERVRHKLEKLQKRQWPGNVRELRHVMERAVLVSRSDVIQPGDLGLQTAQQSRANLLEEMDLESVEAHLIRKALDRHNGNAITAAKALGLSRSAFYRRLQKYNISG